MRLLCLILWVAPLLAQSPPEGMVLVPAGEFVMGSESGGADEAPAHLVYVSAFYIDVHEVTIAEFAEFVRRSVGYRTVEGPWFRYSAEGAANTLRFFEQEYGASLDDFNPAGGDEEARRLRDRDLARWRSAAAALRELARTGESLESLIGSQARLPVRGVAWRDAAAFAKWAGKRLPTEAEWEKAARGTGQRRYPGGSEWNPAAVVDSGGPLPVGSRPGGASPYGCLDMAGNVWEWVADWYGESDYASSRGARNPAGPSGLPDGRLPEPSPDLDLLRSTRQGREPDTRKVIRGGGFSGSRAMAAFNARTSRRLWSNPDYWHPDVGFRCVKNAK